MAQETRPFEHMRALYRKPKSGLSGQSGSALMRQRLQELDSEFVRQTQQLRKLAKRLSRKILK